MHIKFAVVGDESISEQIDFAFKADAWNAEIVQANPDFVIVVADDIATYSSLKRWQLPREKVIGIGTLPSTMRFRKLIADRLKLHVEDVCAYVAGAREGGEVPLWSSASVANIPLHEWAVQGHGKLSVMDRTAIFQDAKGPSQDQVVAAVLKILAAIHGDQNRVLSVSSLVENFHGIGDVCLSLPCIVNARGVENPLPIHLNANEELGLQNSAETIRSAIKKLGF